MAWIYLAVSEDSQKLSTDTSNLSLIVKTTDMLKPFSYHEWLQENCRLLRYGTTLQPSSQQASQGSRLSTEVFPARTLALQAAEKAWQESAADYFLRSSGSSARYDRDSFSWRTFQQSLFEEQSELLANLLASGMTVDGEFYPLRINDVGANHRRERWWLLANASTPQLHESGEGINTPWGSQIGFGDSSWWATEPNVGRVAHGVPFRVDRLRGLGNAVVPAQAREAFERLIGIK